MTNVGSIDRMVCIVIGILLIAFSIPLGFPQTGRNWIGCLGVVPVLTADLGDCTAYSLFGMSTCPTQQRR